jgi:dienelactone hydrolase
MQNTGELHRHHRALVVLVFLLSIAAAACGGSDDSSDSDDGVSATTTTPLADQAAYADTGPYEVGTTTLDLDGRSVEVWYPADPGSEVGAEQAVFEIRDLLPENLKAIVPDELNPRYVTDAYVGIPVSEEGPFPLVIFAHGFAAYPTEYQYLLAHLASWGLVVAGPDFNERGLLAAFTGTTERSDETAVMIATKELLAAANEEVGNPLEGAVDTTKVGTGGHSAGVEAVGAAAADPDVLTFVAMSGGRGPDGSTEPQLPVPDKPSMVVTGGRDEIAGIDRVRDFYSSLMPPKRLIIIDEAGHNAFNDLCVIGAEQGGLLVIAEQVGITPTEQIQRLFLDGCAPEYLPAQEAWAATRHFVTAHYRYELGIDPEPVGLGAGVVSAFQPVAVTYEVTP